MEKELIDFIKERDWYKENLSISECVAQNNKATNTNMIEKIDAYLCLLDINDALISSNLNETKYKYEDIKQKSTSTNHNNIDCVDCNNELDEINDLNCKLENLKGENDVFNDNFTQIKKELTFRRIIDEFLSKHDSDLKIQDVLK